MAQITVTVNNKHYPLACADGEEERLTKLAAYVDGKTKDLGTKLGHVSEARLILMAAVLIADELHDSIEQKGGAGILDTLSEGDLAGVLNEVAGEVEAIAEKLVSA